MSAEIKGINLHVIKIKLIEYLKLMIIGINEIKQF